jgi:PAS domain S-box-containing protein
MRILEALPTAIVVLSQKGRVRFANERAASIFGFKRAELEGKPTPTCFGAVAGAGAAEEASKATRARQQCTVTTRDGRAKTVGFAVSKSQDDTIIVFQDISTTARLQEERDKLMSLAAIAEALPSLLHELKNPLAAITAAVEVLIEEVAPGAVMDQLHAILSEVRRMKLGFEGIGAVHGRLRSERPSAIDHAIREACRVLQPQLRNSGIRFRLDIKDLPLLPLDPAMLRAIIFNLVTNARHACKAEDTIILHAQLENTKQALTLVVVDTGSGMTPDVLSNATELFFTTKASGSGIGLALCARAVEAAGGQLTLSSVPGVGTSVSVVIPLQSIQTRPGVQGVEKWPESTN